MLVEERQKTADLAGVPYLTLSLNIESALVGHDFARVLIFERSGGKFFIDHNLQEINHHHLYVVPPTHSYRLSIESVGNVICLDIPEDSLTDECRQIMYRIAYDKGKGFDFGEALPYYNLLKERMKTGKRHIFEDELLSPVSRSIKKAQSRVFKPKYGYMEMIRNFYLSYRHAAELRKNTIPEVCQTLNLHKQTLQRAFKEILGHSPQAVADMRIVSEAVYMLSQPSRHGASISSIAYELNFPNESDFARHFKKVTGHSPSRFRMYMYEQLTTTAPCEI